MVLPIIFCEKNCNIRNHHKTPASNDAYSKWFWKTHFTCSESFFWSLVNREWYMLVFDIKSTWSYSEFEDNFEGCNSFHKLSFAKPWFNYFLFFCNCALYKLYWRIISIYSMLSQSPISQQQWEYYLRKYLMISRSSMWLFLSFEVLVVVHA